MGKLRAELAQATAARDALAHQFAALLSQNAALLRATRTGASAQPTSPGSYAGTLLQRRQAIAAAELLEELGSPGGSGGGGSGGGGGGGGGSGAGAPEEAKALREAVTLQLERLRTLRWREICLESSLAGALGAHRPSHVPPPLLRLFLTHDLSLPAATRHPYQLRQKSRG